MTDKGIEEAVAKILADKIVEAMNGEHRDTILAKAVTQILTGYEIKRACEEAVTARVKKIAEEALASGKYDGVITTAIHEGFSKLLVQLPTAIQKTLTDALFGAKKGNSGRYDDTPGLILRHLL